MNIEEGNKKIAIKICSGICDGNELLKHDPYIAGTRETLIGYSTIEKTLDEKEINSVMGKSDNDRVISEEDEPII